jgi:O-antigen/teichoic acid export membrane protein
MIESAWGWLEARRRRALPAGSLRARTTRGTFWSIAGAGVAQGLALGVSMIGARVLGREGFGELGIVTSTVGMFGVFAGLRLGTTATKYVAELRVTDPGRASKILSLSLWTAALDAPRAAC